MKRIATSLALLSLALAPVATRADGGMWMPQQMVDLAPRLKKLGFQGNPKAFSDLTGMPMGAIVSLGGCSASFVSKDGLIITNHHCVTGALQYNATPERNTVKEGFLAPTRADEAWAGPGSRVFVTVAVREVTKDVVGKLAADLDDLAAPAGHREARPRSSPPPARRRGSAAAWPPSSRGSSGSRSPRSS